MPSVNSDASADVAIIGGGAIGVAAAYSLSRDGASVLLVKRGPQLGWGCSAGNAGIVGPSHVLPLAGPGALRDGLRWLGRADSPFAIQPRPRLMPWLARFCAASIPQRVAHSRRVLRPLALESARLHADLASEGLETGFQRRGLLNVYATERAFAEAVDAAAEDRRDGMRAQAVDAAVVAQAWPQINGRPAGAIFYEDEAHCDPAAFVRALGQAARERGVTIRTGVEVLALKHDANGVRTLWTTAGEISAGQVVLAAGAWSPELAASVPLRLPVQGGKGYHIDVAVESGDPMLPVWFQEHRVVVTPMPGRLRLAGTLELAGVDARVDERRVNAVVEAARKGLRGLDGRRVEHVWRGLRPCTPDGLPVVGRVPWLENLIVATGHGMWGLQLAPLTGRMIAEVISGKPVGEALDALRPERFGVPHARRTRA